MYICTYQHCGVGFWDEPGVWLARGSGACPLCFQTPQSLPHPAFSIWGSGLVCKAHRLLYHSALGLRVKEKKKKAGVCGLRFRDQV